MVTPTQPIVSIIIPVWNSERYLAEAINSLLSQELDSFSAEIIIIDDGSTDGTAALIQQLAPQVGYYFQHHQGISAALNYGIRMAQGQFLAFLYVNL